MANTMKLKNLGERGGKAIYLILLFPATTKINTVLRTCFALLQLDCLTPLVPPPHHKKN